MSKSLTLKIKPLIKPISLTMKVRRNFKKVLNGLRRKPVMLLTGLKTKEKISKRVCKKEPKELKIKLTWLTTLEKISSKKVLNGLKRKAKK